MKINNILNRSTKATCGVTEREVTVKNQNVSKAINTLKKEGYHVIGKSINGRENKKIWFIRRGGF